MSSILIPVESRGQRKLLPRTSSLTTSQQVILLVLAHEVTVLTELAEEVVLHKKPYMKMLLSFSSSFLSSVHSFAGFHINL